MLKIDPKKYKAILFDFDGTLVNSEPLHYQAISDALANFDKKYVTFEEHEKIYRGTGMNNVVTKETQRNNLQKTHKDELKKTIDINLKTLMDEKGMQPTGGVLQFVKNARKKGLKLAIVSGSFTDLIIYTLGKSNIPNDFDEVVGIDKFIEPKPDPACFLLAAKLLGVKPSECLVFEDAPSGIQAAQRAEMDVIALGDSSSKSIGASIAIIKDFTKVLI